MFEIKFWQTIANVCISVVTVKILYKLCKQVGKLCKTMGKQQPPASRSEEHVRMYILDIKIVALPVRYNGIILSLV